MPITGYHHVTREQRCQIYALKSRGISLRQIAYQLNLSPSTISREIKRNSGGKGYRYEQADKLAKERRSLASQKPKKMTLEIKQLIVEALQWGWSPKQMSGRLNKDQVINISPESIYQFVWMDKKQGGSLYLFLRHRTKPYNKRGNKKAGRGCIPNRVDIEKRPKVVEKKSRIGDWEADTIMGAHHKRAIVSIVDRKSKYTILEKVSDKTANKVTEAINARLSKLPHKVHTMRLIMEKNFRTMKILLKL